MLQEYGVLGYGWSLLLQILLVKHFIVGLYKHLSSLEVPFAWIIVIEYGWWYFHKKVLCHRKRSLVEYSLYLFLNFFNKSIFVLHNKLFRISEYKSRNNASTFQKTKSISYLNVFILGNWTRHSTSSLPSWQSCLPSHL